MTPIKSIIVEDEPKSKAMLTALINKYCPQIQILGDATNVQDAVTLIKQYKPDLVFLDIELPKEKGLELFKYFDKVNFEVIFTTAYDQYTINALRLSALDYLLKPIDLQELRMAIQQFEKKKQQKQPLYQNLQQHFFNKKAPKRLVLPSKDNYTFLEIDDIMYCLIESSYTTFVDKHQQKYLVSKPIKDYADLLYDFGFLRIHRSALANPKYIKKIIKTRPSSIIMKDDTELSIAKNRRDFVITSLINR